MCAQCLERVLGTSVCAVCLKQECVNPRCGEDRDD
jgi:hypothetical protein